MGAFCTNFFMCFSVVIGGSKSEERRFAGGWVHDFTAELFVMGVTDVRWGLARGQGDQRRDVGGHPGGAWTVQWVLLTVFFWITARRIDVRNKNA